jgi:hypothetical protein
MCFPEKKIMRSENFLISSHHDTSRLPAFRKMKRFPLKKKAASAYWLTDSGPGPSYSFPTLT